MTTAFGGDAGAIALVRQPDGKMVRAEWAIVNGSTDFALVCYKPDGSLDPTFGVGGKVTTDFGGSEVAFTCILPPDGKIVVASNTSILTQTFIPEDFVLAWYNPDGSLNATVSSAASGVIWWR